MYKFSFRGMNMAHQIWQKFPVIADQLDDLRTYLLGLIDLSNKPIQSKIVELLSAGGKLLRPGYFYLFAELGNTDNQTQLRAGAASIELLHVATLIHDDVVDESPLRRNVVTIHTQYGKKNAVYAGDFLFTLYFNQIIKAANDLDDVASNAQVMHDILNGELNQMQLNYKFDVTIDEYLHEIDGKTAKLFELACVQGARLSGCDAEIMTLATKIGHNIGIAYQIQDDILDYAGNKHHTQKPILEDVAEGVYSLPLILALQTEQKLLKPYLKKKQKMTKTDILAVQKIVLESGGVTKAQQLSAEYTNEALALIHQLPAGQSQEILTQLTSSLLTRNA